MAAIPKIIKHANAIRARTAMTDMTTIKDIFAYRRFFPASIMLPASRAFLYMMENVKPHAFENACFPR